MHNAAPTSEAIAVHSREQALRKSLKELILVHAWPPERLTHAVQLLGGGARNDEVLSLRHGTNEIEGAHERFVIRVEASNDGLREPRTEALLVQHRGDHVPDHLGLHRALFLEAEELDAEVQQLTHRLHIGGEPGETDISLVGELEELLPLAAHCHEL